MDAVMVKPCVDVKGVGVLGLLGVKVMYGGKIELVFVLRFEVDLVMPDCVVRDMMQAVFGLPETMRDITNKLVVKFNRVIVKDPKALKRQEECKRVACEVKELMKEMKKMP